MVRQDLAGPTTGHVPRFVKGYADGGVATIWAPDDASGSIKVDLGKKILISRITPQWTDALPDTYQILTSTDGTHWTPGSASDAGGTLQHPVNAGTSASTSPERPAARGQAFASWR
jgi:hypothetical protein